MLEKILVFLLLAFLVIPAIQKEFSIFPEWKPDGDFISAEKPEFNWSSWKTGDFQSNYNQYLNDHAGFHGVLIRIYNQLDYSLFRIPHAEGVVIGKNNQFFEYDYIRAYTGHDFVGEENIDKYIRMFKYLQVYLKQKSNIDLVLVFEPGKTSFYPENIPNHYLNKQSKNSNYECYHKKAEAYQINFLDLNEYFKQLKGTKPYPLYPEHGIHWSAYGMTFAVDTLIKYMESARQIDLPEVVVDTLLVHRLPQWPDYDVEKAMNLLWRYRESRLLAYPQFKFIDGPGKVRPMVAVIGDSYYWSIYNAHIPQNLFKNEAFWYFFSQAYPESFSAPKSVNEMNLREEIEKQDVILVMVTERFLYKFGWSFVEKAYRTYAPSSEYNQIFNYKSEIWNYDPWFSSIIDKAKNRRISVKEMLDLEAKYVFEQREPEKYFIQYGLDHYIDQIRKVPEWWELVKSKSEKEGIDLDAMILREADYAFKTYQPDAYKIYSLIKKNKNSIRNDSILSLETQTMADQYFMTYEEMLQIEAEKMIKEQQGKLLQ
ncbi:MAG: hypothetical protein JW731_16690 [Bacteroidales bacterium]|nr:hypothetical protein [Bacteroidales bacterium]